MENGAFASARDPRIEGGRRDVFCERNADADAGGWGEAKRDIRYGVYTYRGRSYEQEQE